MNNRKNNPKGRAFNGIFSGRRYERGASLFGMGKAFYREAVAGLGLGDGMKALDLGCGPGALCFALAEISSGGSEIFGVDLAEDQVRYAEERREDHHGHLRFSVASMDEVEFPDASLDLVMTSMAMHEAAPEVRRSAVDKACRMLKPGGKFLLIDWGKPRFGLWGILFYPLCCWGQNNKDNWNNTYEALCEGRGLRRCEDGYMNSIIRRQVFIKEIRPDAPAASPAEGTAADGGRTA